MPGRLGKVRPRYLGPIGLGFAAAHYLGCTQGVIASQFADITWLSRELVRWSVSFEPMLKHPMVFDVDDAIWLRRPFIPRIAKHADAAFAGNAFIADYLQQYCDQTFIVPTAVDTHRFRPRSTPDRTSEDGFVIGWTGSSANLHYLAMIQRPLRRVLDAMPDAKLRIICDKPPALPDLQADRIDFIRWHPEIEATGLTACDVGIMPLADTDWERGKCSFKMLQYMACGLPVVVSPVGMNNEVLAHGGLGFAASTDDDWYDALMHLATDPGMAQQMGAIGRGVVEERYSVEVVAHCIACLFHQIEGARGTAAEENNRDRIKPGEKP